MPPLVVAEVAMDPALSDSVEPLTVKLEVLTPEPSLVNESEFTVIRPILFVEVVCVWPTNTMFHGADVVGWLDQFDELAQLPLPPPPVHVALPIGVADASCAQKQPHNATAIRQAVVRANRTMLGLWVVTKFLAVASN